MLSQWPAAKNVEFLGMIFMQTRRRRKMTWQVDRSWWLDKPQNALFNWMYLQMTSLWNRTNVIMIKAHNMGKVLNPSFYLKGSTAVASKQNETHKINAIFDLLLLIGSKIRVLFFCIYNNAFITTSLNKTIPLTFDRLHVCVTFVLLCPELLLVIFSSMVSFRSASSYISALAKWEMKSWILQKRNNFVRVRLAEHGICWRPVVPCYDWSNWAHKMDQIYNAHSSNWTLGLSLFQPKFINLADNWNQSLHFIGYIFF